MTKPQKETIYVDVDDEITGIIEKVQDSKSNILAVVLPKRAAVLQSTVNMRLLKRAATDNKKNVVLITSEAAILPLAGAVGMHVAKTLQSKPAIPPAPEVKSATLTLDDESDNLENIDPKTPIGKLAGDDDHAETIEDDYVTEGDGDKKSAKKGKGSKKFKIPNFERFRLWLMLGGAAVVLLIVGLIWALIFAPKAKVTIKTDTSTISSNLDFTASSSAKSLDVNGRVVPTTTVQIEKTDTQKVSATGQKDNGTKASGKVTLKLTDCSQSQVTVPSGTVVSASNANFITQEAATLNRVIVGPNCANDSYPAISSATVNVVAQNGGDKYNLSARTYTVTGFSNVSGSGTAMTGGTTQLVKILSQQDFDNAKQQLLDRTKGAALTDLQKKLTDSNQFPLNDSITATNQSITAAPDINQETEESTVTAKITYTLVGVAKNDLNQLISSNVKGQIDPSTQQIQDNGLGNATVKLQDKKSNGDIPVNLQTQVVAGPQLDTEGIKKEIAGKKRGQALAIIQKRPGVKDVTIQYSPFWVLSTPKKTAKITVVFEQADGSK